MGFYRYFFSIYAALVLQNVVTLSVNLADNMMLGGYSETALAGVAAVNQIQFIFQQIVIALGDGLVIVGSQYWGKRQTGPMRKISASAMAGALFVALILFFTVSFFPYEALRIFTEEETIVEAGVSYLMIIRFTYLFFAVTQILLASLRSVEMVGIAFKLSVMTFFINCGINYVLIYGHFGAPAMGAAGAAVGTLAARMAELLVLLIYISRKEKNLQLSFRSFLTYDGRLTMDYVKIVYPMVIVQGLWGLNTAMQKLFLAIGAVSGITLFLIRIPILSMYHLEVETMEMANTFLMILSVVIIGMSYQMPTNNGIVRGGGSAMFVVKLDSEADQRGINWLK